MTYGTLSALTLGLSLLTPFVAQAQFAREGSSPVTITADKANYQGEKTVLTGGVDVRQGDVRILADEMTVYSAGTGSLADNDFNKIVAEGHFYYLTPDQNVRGEKGVYTRANETFTVTGNVIMKQTDGNVITGDTLIYNLKTENARVIGTCTGRKCGSTGRVKILIKNTKKTSTEQS